MTVATGPATCLEVGFEHDTARLPLDACRQFLHLGHQGDLLEQVVDAGALQRGHLHHDGVAAQASGTRPRSESCWSTRVESASGRSILLTATMIGTSAARA